MNRFFYILVASFVIFTSCQRSEKKSEQELKAQKIKFLTQKMDLTPAESEVFWPVYNEYWNRKYKIIGEKRSAMKYCMENINSMKEEEIAKYADMYINFQKQEADLLIEFNEKFKSILPPAKVFKLYNSDYEFKNYLLQQIKKSGEK